MSYDPKCYELAEVFLSDTNLENQPKLAHELAQQIQDTIEGNIEWWLAARTVEQKGAA